MDLSSAGPLIWAKDEEGHRHLCPLELLSDPNHVGSEEMAQCIDDDSRLQTKEYVPSNEPEGKIRFTNSVSPN